MELRTRLGLVFGLVLALQAAAAGSAAAQEAAAAPAAAGDPAQVAKGDTIFHKTGMCYACHGSNAQGSVGPNLTDAEWIHGDGSVEMIAATVTAGIPKEKAKSGIPMPAKGGSSISDEDVKAVAAYVYSLSHK
jgi:cbb3-type cytochrome c oxidase subunit III